MSGEPTGPADPEAGTDVEGDAQPAAPAPDLRRVHIVGTGLIGTSIGLALAAHGLDVTLEDPSPTAMGLAADLGAGRIADPLPEPDLVVVACPPDVAGGVVAAALARHPRATVTDVASVKEVVETEVAALAGPAARRYVGSHPMAGRERSGAIAARSDLFVGRPWVVVTRPGLDPTRSLQVERIAALTGAVVARMAAAEHDGAVAAVSHVPQVAASLVASRLRELPTHAVGLAGQGVRDVTRIAASDPALWTQILVGNARAVRGLLVELAADLDGIVRALAELEEDAGAAPGARAVLAGAIADGNAGRERIPGKHGSGPTRYAVVTVLVPDRPGMLGRLFVEIGEEGVNLEDVHLEHELGRPVGIAEVSVVPAAAAPLREALRRRGWSLSD